jgi:hypothetical protein
MIKTLLQGYMFEPIEVTFRSVALLNSGRSSSALELVILGIVTLRFLIRALPPHQRTTVCACKDVDKRELKQ